MVKLDLITTKKGSKRVSSGHLTTFVDGTGYFTLKGIAILAEAFAYQGAKSFKEDFTPETVTAISRKYGVERLMLLTTKLINGKQPGFEAGRLAAFAAYQATV